MVVNESPADRLVRGVLGIVLVVLAFVVGLGSVLGWVLLVVGAVLLITGATGFCPIYKVMKMSTLHRTAPRG